MTAPAVSADVVMALGPFETPEAAGLAAAEQAHGDVADLGAELLLAGNNESRVKVHGDGGFCVIYAPSRQTEDGWYSGGQGTPCEVIEGG